MTDKSRTVQTDAGEIEFLWLASFAGVRFSVSVQWNKIGFMQSRRFLCVKVGAHEVYHEEFNEPNRRHACSILTAMLASSESDLCKYLTRALMEVEL